MGARKCSRHYMAKHRPESPDQKQPWVQAAVAWPSPSLLALAPHPKWAQLTDGKFKKKKKKKTLIGKLKWKSWGHARAAQKYGACMSDQPQKWGRSVPCTPRQGWGVTQGETNASLEVTLHLPAETRILVLISKSLALCGVRPWTFLQLCAASDPKHC